MIPAENEVGGCSGSTGDREGGPGDNKLSLVGRDTVDSRGSCRRRVKPLLLEE